MEVEKAQNVTAALEDDLDGGPADETVRFGFEGADYEIDLSSKNASAFRQHLTPFTEHARGAGRGQATGQPGRQRAASSARHPSQDGAWTPAYDRSDSYGRSPAMSVSEVSNAPDRRLRAASQW